LVPSALETDGANMNSTARLTGRLVAAARALTGISQSELAIGSGISLEMVRLLESSSAAWVPDDESQALGRALETFGVVAKRGTMPVSTGSPTMTTMGISPVDCFAASGDVERHDYIELEPDKLGRQFRKSIQLSFRGPKLECDVLSLDIAKYTQPFPEFLPERLCVLLSKANRTGPRIVGSAREA
jgi:transcriptional regulator with XRE-family HTH domain